MYVRVTSTRNSPRKSIKVVESVREGYKVKQVMICHIGIAADEKQIEKLKQLGKAFILEETLRRKNNSQQLSLLDPIAQKEYLSVLEKRTEQKNRGRKPVIKLEAVTAEDRISLSELVEEKRVIEGIHDVAGHVYDQLSYNTLVTRSKDQMLLKDLVLMRLVEPASKLKSQQFLDKRFARTHDLDAIYRLMDKLYPNISAIKQATFAHTKKILPDSIDILFFDCTTLYFESIATDELRAFGYSKDHRFNTTQVVLALATNGDGLPIGYELFEGNKAEVKTLLACLDEWKKLFSIKSVCFVADRAMMSDENLAALEEQGHQYVVAAKLRTLPKTLQAELFSEGHYKTALLNGSIGWVGEFEYKARRLIVSYKTDRARKDAHQRQQILDKLKKRLGEKGNTQRLITNQGVKKYTRSENAITLLDHDKIAQDAAWDGLHGIITNIRGEQAGEILARYGRLWKIEESFRINKHTLSMRPIYHFKPERIKTHIALCFMTFSVLRHMECHIKLTQKISLETLLDELTYVQASYYRHTPSDTLYRMPGRFSQTASKIYKAFQLQRNNHAQRVVHTHE